jgi:hypothetical protein
LLPKIPSPAPHYRSSRPRARPNPYIAAQLASAANAWTIERWLGRGKHFRSLMLICNQIPEHAAAEIQRVGRKPNLRIGKECRIIAERLLGF